LAIMVPAVPAPNMTILFFIVLFLNDLM
jgi:hypothetical protein